MPEVLGQRIRTRGSADYLFMDLHVCLDGQTPLELRGQTFSLFNGVFGASDEVLGTLESGVDFEKRILAIYQECRAPED